MRLLISGVLIVFLLSTNVNAQQKHSFEIKEGNFLYDAKPIQIRSGELHYARVPEQYWKHRLQMIKAMGLNTVATYVFWNYHETAPGFWDFTTGNRNIRAFIKTAADLGLMVILRPGPYACAEWEFGGYPWWIQKNKALVIRANNKPFLDSCNVYISKLISEVKDLQITNGGPIIMIQAENEFGSYVAQRKDIPLAEHKKYSLAIKKSLLNAGVTVPLFTSDGSWLFQGGAIEGALPTANGEDDVVKLKKVVNQFNGGKGPYMVAEFYPGWLDHWAEPFPKVSKEEVVGQLKKYVDSFVSFNFYMVHGGTNFGFTTGANYDKNHDIQPDMTSYDYDAPISEAGWATEKYKAIRNLLMQQSSKPLPSIPEALPVISIPAIKFDKSVDLFSLKDKLIPTISTNPLSFEDLNQGNGYVLYSKKFVQPISGVLNIKGLRDYATIYVNGEKVGVLNRYTKTYSMPIDIPFNAVLEILVENMGRINYGSEIVNNLKGIVSPIMIDSTEITGNWNIYGFPFNEKPNLTNFSSKNAKGLPSIFKASFQLQQIGDSFLDMSAWGKGIVFVNGHNLGRYWSVGPQQTIYLPGVWLKKGLNEIQVFEQLNDQESHSIEGLKQPILERLKKL